jgi:hypothetical protein
MHAAIEHLKLLACNGILGHSHGATHLGYGDAAENTHESDDPNHLRQRIAGNAMPHEVRQASKVPSRKL